MINQGFNFKRSDFDCCVYVKHIYAKISIYLLLYFDDMLIASQSDGEIKSLKLKLKSAFEIKELGEAKKILGIEIFRNKQKSLLQLSQKSYLEKLLRKFTSLGNI